MAKLTLTDLTNLNNDLTVIATLNANNANTEAAMENTLSRDGTSPNQMGANLDMNSWHILNLPEPSSDTDPVRLIDLTNVSTITNLIHTASSTSNTIGTGTKTFTVPSGLGFQVGQYVLIQENGNTANVMSGRVLSYSGTTLSVDVTNTLGSGTISNWTIDVSGAPGSNGATGATGATGPAGTPVNVYDTRTIAIAAAIPGTTNFVKTLAYDSTGTPNSGSTFVRVPAGTPFIDTWPTNGTITGGSGYVNGTYFGRYMTFSATGLGIYATITVAGGAVTAVDFSTQPGNKFKVGDVLTVPDNTWLGGTGSGFTYTVTTISTPLASFTNTSDGSLWQYIPTQGHVHVNEFGAKGDFVNLDASATNNFSAIQAALFFATANPTGTTFDSGGYNGNIVKLGVGSYMINQPTSSTSLIIPNGVYLEGVHGSTIKIHESWSGSTHCICVGNPAAHFANFNCGLRNLEVFVKLGTSTSSGVAAVYSNNLQDGGGIEHCHIFGGPRTALRYEISYGGGSIITFKDLNLICEATLNPCFYCDVGTSIIDCRNWSTGSSAGTTNAVVLSGTGGMYNFENVHIEGCPTGFLVNLAAGNNPMVSFKNITGGPGVDYLFALQASNAPGNAGFQQCQKNNGSALGLVLNGQGGGTSRTTDIFPSDGIVFFDP
jgi:hypothetical protein